MAEGPGATYARAGVDVAAGEEAVERIRAAVASTAGPEVIGGIGDFGGLFALPAGRWRQPVLVSGTDGVGTKAALATAAGRYDTIGVDLVAMCVDDVACQGAEPLFALDYLAMGCLDPDVAAVIVAGVAAGCRQAGCALIGGEMAEHPGAMGPGSFDLAGFAVGVVERDQLLGPQRVRPGDAMVGLASPGLRCNGYALARHVLVERAGRDLGAPAWPGAARSLADELLEPSVIYAPALLGLGRVVAIRAVAHITGGGIPTNLARILPGGCDAVVDRSSWARPEVFAEIQRVGEIADAEMEAVFNLGLGMIAVVPRSEAEAAVAVLGRRGRPAGVVGHIEEGRGQVRLVGRPAGCAAGLRRKEKKSPPDAGTVRAPDGVVPENVGKARLFNSKQAVLKLLERGREHRDQPFQLSSGEWSHDYIDAKLAISTAAGLRTAAEGVLALVDAEELQFDAVGGLTMGADPLAHAISLLSGKAWFSVRKEPKKHGRQRCVEGAILSAGTRTLLLDDVVTTGKSIVAAVDAVTEIGAPVVAAVALVDRGETARSQLESRNLCYRPLLTYHDLGIDPVGIERRGAPQV